ncbi:hypothetical protein CHARACLAT_026600 [Characodon lateralis]|uniref:Uncharacterized protein n=1 Tax=Characodon lateralis TaxID=208331 RepID=A0ABU7E3R1_9TELE|nr:hypothetical protein [Characodon lateralis]
MASLKKSCLTEAPSSPPGFGRSSVIIRKRHSTLFRLKIMASDLEAPIIIPATSHSAAIFAPVRAINHKLMKPIGPHHPQKAETQSFGHQNGSPQHLGCT